MFPVIVLKYLLLASFVELCEISHRKPLTGRVFFALMHAAPVAEDLAAFTSFLLHMMNAEHPALSKIKKKRHFLALPGNSTVTSSVQEVSLPRRLRPRSQRPHTNTVTQRSLNSASMVRISACGADTEREFPA